MENRTGGNLTRTTRTDFEIRSDPDGKKTISGYFAVFGSETELYRGVYEELDPSAFDDTLSGDIRALTNHDTGLVLGRTKAGTLRLSKDTRGLWGEITINENDTDAVNLYERVKRGDVDQCSFGFKILEEEVEWRDDDTAKWTLKKVELYEVSVCTFPAYEDTGVQARSTAVEQHKQKQLETWRHKQKQQLKKENE